MACFEYTYKGKTYTKAEFTKMLADGLLDELKEKEIINLNPIGSTEKEAKKSSKESKQSAEGDYVSIRKSELSDAQDIYKRAPKSEKEKVTEGLANLKIEKGETLNSALERVVFGIEQRLKAGEKVALNTDETVQVAYYKAKIQSDMADLGKKMITGEIGPSALMAEKALLEEKKRIVDAVLGATGQEQGSAFGFRNYDFLLSDEQKLNVARLTVYGEMGGKPKKIAIQEQIDALVEKIVNDDERVQKKIQEEYDKGLKEGFEKAMAQERKQPTTKKSQRSKAEILEDLEKARAKFRIDAANLSSGGLQAIKSLAKVVSLALELGIRTAKDFYKEFKDDFVGFSEQEVTKAFEEHLKKENEKAKTELLDKIKEIAKKENATTLTNSMVEQGLVRKLAKEYSDLPPEKIASEIVKDLKDELPNITEKDVYKAHQQVDEFRQQKKSEIEKQNEAEKQTFSKVASKQVKIAEIEKKIEKLRNENKLWEKTTQGKKLSEDLQQVRYELKEELAKQGKNVGGEKIKDREQFAQIGERHNERIEDFKTSLGKAIKSENNEVIKKKLQNVLDKLDTFKVDTKTAEKLNDVLERTKNSLGDSLKDVLSDLGKNELANDVGGIKKAIERDIEATRIEIATQSFLDRTKSKILQNEKRIASKDFEAPNPAVPKLNKLTIEAQIARNKSQNELKRVAEKYKKENAGKLAKNFDRWREYRVMALISSIKAEEKVGIASVSTPTFESLSLATGHLNPIQRFLTRNLRKAQGSEGFFGLSQKTALKAFLPDFKSEEEAKAHNDKIDNALIEAQYKFQEAKDILDNIKDKNSKEYKDAENGFNEAKAEYQEATLNSSLNVLPQFIGAKSQVEFMKKIRGNVTAIENAFGLDGGKKKGEASDAFEKMMFQADILARSHGALKSYSGRFSFARAFANNLINGLKRGEDIQSPENQLIYAYRSLLEYKKGTFTNDNLVVQRINQNIKELRQGMTDGDANKHSENLAKFAGLLLQVEYPIQKIGMNMLNEAVFRIGLGAVTSLLTHGAESYKSVKGSLSEGKAITEALNEMGKNIAKLPPEKADRIIEGYRKGAIGGFLLASAMLGWVKVNDDGTLTMFGHTFGKNMTYIVEHIPAIMTSAIFAHSIKTYDEVKEKTGDEKQAWKEAIKEFVHQVGEKSPYSDPSRLFSKEGLASLFPVPPVFGEIRGAIEGKKDNEEYAPQDFIDVMGVRGGYNWWNIPTKGEEANTKYEKAQKEKEEKEFEETLKSESIKKIEKKEKLEGMIKKMKSKSYYSTHELDDLQDKLDKIK